MERDDEMAVTTLQATVDLALAETIFYPKHWRNVDTQLKTVDDLARFPLVEKKHLREAQASLLTRSKMPDFLLFTGGTLVAPTLLERDLEEAANWARRNEEAFRMLGGERKRLGLSLSTPTNATGFHVPGWPVLAIPLLLEKHFHLAVSLLTRTFHWTDSQDRVSVLIGNTERIKLLTSWLIGNDVQVDTFAIEDVYCSGTLLTRRWKRIIETYWQANVTETYGLSETPGVLFSTCRWDSPALRWGWLRAWPAWARCS